MRSSFWRIPERCQRFGAGANAEGGGARRAEAQPKLVAAVRVGSRALAFPLRSRYAARMAKPKRRYACHACGSVTHRWQGQCADCGEWNTLIEEAPETVFSARHDLSGGGRAIVFEPLDAPGGERLER